MRAVLAQFVSWDHLQAFDPMDLYLAIGDQIVVNGEFGSDLATVVEIRDLTESELAEYGGQLQPIERLATAEDKDFWSSNNNSKAKAEALAYCCKTARKHGLEMKLVDCYFSFDDKRLMFAFIAPGRVDFRDLVKELTRYFQRSVRLYQLGVRDEAKLIGDIGPCGKVLCCGHLKKLGNVSSDFAENQQVAHRGSDRLSGVCSRLKCCLAYENDLYEELSKAFPAKGARVKTNHGKGEVIGWHVLKGTVDVKIQAEDNEGSDKTIIVEVPIKKQ